MNDPRDRVPGPRENASENDVPETSDESASSVPEEADEIIEIVDDDGAVPLQSGQESGPEAEGVDLASAPEGPCRKPAPSAAGPSPSPAEIRELRAKLERKDQQIEQIMEAYRAKKAETEKLRKRIEKTERRRFEQSKGDFIARFVEVLDNLDRAVDSIENASDPDAVLQGIMLVRSRLVQLLREEGLEKIFVKGQPFDPVHSEAAGMENVADESEDGVVIKELQRGYMLKGSLLRAARVVVGRYDAGEGSPGSDEAAGAGSAADAEETDEH